MATMARPLAGALLCLAVLVAAAAGTRASAGSSPRPFDHGRHEAVVPCTTCHGTGERHGAVLVKTPLQCAACHHDAAQPRPCIVCHATDALPQPGTVRHTFASDLFAEPPQRQLPFAHARHAAVPCRDCHNEPVTLAPNRSCGSCHAEHHRPSAECGACHEPPGPPVHEAVVHLSCGGAGCHAPAVAPEPALSRTLCLTCHVQQQTHEVGSACAGCHLLVPVGTP
jgi:hypothetical protein